MAPQCASLAILGLPWQNYAETLCQIAAYFKKGIYLHHGERNSDGKRFDLKQLK